MARWHDITRDPEYQSLSPQAKLEVKREFFNRTISKDEEFVSLSPEAQQATFEEFINIPDDTGQGYVTSMLGSAGRGFGEVVPGVVEGVGALTGIEPIQEAGQDIRAGLEYISPVNPIYAESVPVKLAGVGGQIGSVLATGGIGGAAGRALAAERIAAAGTQAARQAALTQAVQRGAQTALLGTAAAQGAAEGAQQAEQYGMTGPEAYLRTLAGAATEVGTELLPFGMAAETALAKRALASAPRTTGFVGSTLSEGGEEALAQIGSNIATQALAPIGVETPGITAGALEAGAYGAFGGAVIGGINALIPTAPEKQTREQQQWQAEINATPVDVSPNITPEESQKNAAEGGIPVVTPDGVVSWMPAMRSAMTAPTEQASAEPSVTEQRLRSLTDPAIQVASDALNATANVPFTDISGQAAAATVAQNAELSMQPAIQSLQTAEETAPKVTPSPEMEKPEKSSQTITGSNVQTGTEMPVPDKSSVTSPGEAPLVTPEEESLAAQRRADLLSAAADAAKGKTKAQVSPVVTAMVTPQQPTPQENAVQEQITDEGVLRQERPEMELQGMGEQNVQPQETATEGQIQKEVIAAPGESEQGPLYGKPSKLTDKDRSQAVSLAKTLQPGDVVETNDGQETFRYKVVVEDGTRLLRKIDQRGDIIEGVREKFLANPARTSSQGELAAIPDGRDTIDVIARGRIIRSGTVFQPQPTATEIQKLDFFSTALQEAKDEAVEALREAMNSGSGRFKGRNITLLVTPSSRDDVMLQVTRVSNEGEPQGHQDIIDEQDFNDELKDQDNLDIVLEHIRPDIGQARTLKAFGIPKFRKPVSFNYRLRLREVGPGTVPAGFISSDGRDVSYDRPLTRQEMFDFEILPVGATPLTVQPTAAETQTSGVAVERDLTKPEQMTPEEFDEYVKQSGREYYLKHGKNAPMRTGQLNILQDAIEKKLPVSVDAFDAQVEKGRPITLPEGYVRQGDLYVFQPEIAASPTAPKSEKTVKFVHTTKTTPGKGQKSGYYPGTYAYESESGLLPSMEGEKFIGELPENQIYTLQNSEELKDKASKAGFGFHSGNGSAEVKYLQSLGFKAMRRPTMGGTEIIVFDAKDANFQPQTTAAKSLVEQLNEAKSRQEAQAILESATAQQIKEAAQEMGYPATGSKKAVVSRLVAAVGSRADAAAIRQQSPKTTKAAETQTPVPLREGTGAAGVVQSEPSRGSILEVEKESAKTAIESTEKSLEDKEKSGKAESIILDDVTKKLYGIRGGIPTKDAQTVLQQVINATSPIKGSSAQFARALLSKFPSLNGTLVVSFQQFKNAMASLLYNNGKHGFSQEESFSAVNDFLPPNMDAFYDPFFDAVVLLDGKEIGPSVVAHEIGHAIEDKLFKDAPEKTRSDIIDAFNKHIARVEKQPIVTDYLPLFEIWYGSDKARPYSPDMPIDLASTVDMEYLKSFKEWFANQVAKWATSYEKPLSLVDKFFSSVASKIKELFNVVKGYFSPETSVVDYIHSLATSDMRSDIFLPKKKKQVKKQSFFDKMVPDSMRGLAQQGVEVTTSEKAKATGYAEKLNSVRKLLRTGSNNTKAQNEASNDLMAMPLADLQAAFEVVTGIPTKLANKRQLANNVLNEILAESRNEKLPEADETFRKAEIEAEEEERREAAMSYARLHDKERSSNIVTGKVTMADARQAAGLLQNNGISPNAAFTWMGTVDDLLALKNTPFGESHKKLIEQVAANKNIEGTYSNGTAFVFVDQVVVSNLDRRRAKELGISEGVAAAMRVIDHENGHFGMDILSAGEKARIMAFLRTQFTPESLDALAYSRYPSLRKWRTNPESEMRLLDERLRQYIEETKTIPTDGVWKQFWDYIKAIWRKWTGKPQGEPTLQSMKDVVRLIRKALKDAHKQRRDQTKGGDRVLMSYAGTSQFVPAVNLNGRIETGTSHYEAWLKHAIRQIPSYKKDGLSDSEVKDLADRWLVDHPEAMANSMTKEGFVTDEGYLNRQDSLKKFLALGGKQRLDPGEVRDWLDSSDIEDARFSISYASETSQASSLGQQTAREMTASPRKLEAIIGVRQAYESMPKVHGNAVSLAELFDAAAKIVPNLTQVEFNSVVQGMYEDNAALLDNAETPSSIVILPNGAMMSVAGGANDAEYLAAVESGDSGNDNLNQLLRDASPDERQSVVDSWIKRNPNAAARMQRMVDEAAKAAGYETEAYHGSEEEFNEFKNQRTAYGFFFAPDKRTAEFYGPAKKFYLRTANMADFTDPADFSKVAEEAIWSDAKTRSEEKVKEWIDSAVRDTSGGRSFAAKVLDLTDEQMAEYESFNDILGDLKKEWEQVVEVVEEEYPQALASLDKAAPAFNEEVENARRAHDDLEQSWYMDYQDDFVTAAQTLGYDSVFMQDPAGSTGGSPESFVVFSSEQIKSADPVTYDDAGNVIPPPQRFKPASPDIRFSIASTPEQQSAAAKFKSAIIEAAKGTNKQRDYEGRPIKDRIINPLSSDVQDFVEIGQHNTVAFGAFMDAADEMLESMVKDGMSLDEILSKIQSSSFQQELGMFTVEAGQGMAMKAVMGLLLRKTANAERSAKTKAEKIQSSMLHRKAANYFTAVASTPSGQNLYALKALYNDPRTRFIFMENRALADMLKKADHGVNLRFDGAYGATQEATDTNVNASATAATKNIADQAEEAEEDDQDAIDLAAGEATLKDPEKSLYEEYKDLLREEGILARLDREEAETGAKMSISPERRSELAGLTKEERAKLREKNKQRRMEILSKLLGREEDAKTPEQKATRKKREKMAQTAQKRAQKGKEIDAKEEERAAIEMAENKASQIVYRFEELYRQGFKNPPDGMSQKKQKDSIIKAFREQVKNPTSFEVFAERLENLKVGAEVAERLFLTASRERADLIRMKGFKAEKRKVEIADKQASRLIYSTEERLRQGSKDLNTSKDGDSINKAFREQVKSPMSETAFAKRLSALNVSAEAAARLFKTAAREKFDQEAMMAYDLLSGPDAFKKMVREVNAMRPSAQVPFMKRIPWREIFRQPAKSVEEFRKNILLAIMGNDAFKDMDDAQKRQIADMFAEAWGKEREKVLNQLQKRHEDNLEAQGKREAAKALREARNQILEIANLGVFSNDELTRILGEKFGFKTSFTEAEQQKLSELAEKIQDESLSKPVRNKLAREFLATLQSGTQISIAELLSNWWVASVLSGGNTITAIALSFTNGTGIGILGTHIARAIRNMVKGDTAGAIEAITSMFKAYAKHIASFPSAANRAWNYLWTGDVSLLEASANDPFKNVRSLADIARYQIVADQVAKDPNKVKAVMGRFMQFMGRLLSALDAFNVMITKAGTTSLAIRQSGLTADQIRDAELKNDLKFYKDKIIREDPYFNGKAPTSSFDKAYLASLAEAALYKDLAEFGVKMENADYLAAEAAMTMTPTGVGGIVYNKIKALDKDITTESRERLKQAEKAWAAEKDIDTGLKLFTWRALNFLAEQGINALGLRFARFAGNKFNQSLSYIPVLGALRVFETGNKELAEAFKDTIIRNQTIGFIMIIAGMKIIEAIADEPDDKKRGWFINGGWNNLTPDQKKQRLSLGEKQYTIGIGDQVFNYQNWPIGQAIAAIGELSDMIRFSPEKWKEKTTVGKFGSSLVSGMTSALEIPALTQVGEIFGNTMAAKDPSEQTISRLSRVMAGWAGGFMPRFLKDIDYMLKPEMRKYESFYEKAASHIPIYRSYVGKEYYDILGNQIKKNAIPGSRDFDRLAQEPEYKMLGALNARGIWLTPANAEYRMIGKGRYRRRLTQEEADRYSLETGKLYKQMIMRFGPRALQMPVEQAKDYISAKADDMRDLALLKAVR